MIYVKGLSKSFGDNQVIKNIDMHITPGEKVVIIGPSGSGKSTFLRCLNLLEIPTGGTITFDGQEITAPGVDINKVRRHMGMVFQHFNLFNNLTVKDNIMLGPVKQKLMTKEEAEAEALRLLKLVNLEEKADWLVENIRKNEWIQDGDKGWFNGYYDNHGRKVEYSAVSDETDNKAGAECNTRMMLTGQVFAVMSGTATEDQIQAICRSADAYLYDRKAGGYRLNTDFKEEKFDLGRMFGFAYGEKENGAVFSHMAVMYANALYKTGHAKEGYKVLQTLLDTAMDFERSKMYPGIPEYFDNQGRGLYAYLTGAASWYMLTMITEVFGVKGQLGDMVIAPALMPEQYDQEGKASLKIEFAGRKFSIHIFNREKKEWNKVQIKEAFCDGTLLSAEGGRQARLKRSEIEKLTLEKVHEINIILN